MKTAPETARFQFGATNEWVSGTHSRSHIHGFYGPGQEDTSRAEPFAYDADHPAVLVGWNRGADPGRVPAARHRRVPHRGPGEHRAARSAEGDRDSARRQLLEGAELFAVAGQPLDAERCLA